MKKLFVIVTIALFLSAMCAPVITVSAQEPQKKETAVKKEKSSCDKPCTKEVKESCCAVDKKEAEKKEVKKVEKKKKK